MLRLRLVAVVVMLAASTFVSPPAAVADTEPVCGTSGGHTLCISFPSKVLTGERRVTVTNSPNRGTVFIHWVPTGRAKILLQTSFTSNPTSPQDYSFVWPTQKYLDAGGVLRVQFGSASAASIEAPVTLSNGNTSDFQHTPNDWQDFLPGPWQRQNDPVVAAVGDGASNEKSSNAVAKSIVAANPALFFYLGDVYEEGTFTEFRNHYGRSSMDDPGGGTLWGKLAHKTQPTIGNHEQQRAYADYWHDRPTFTSFRFGGVLFLDLYSGMTRFAAGSEQFQFVQSKLESAPPCVVAVWHHPAIAGGTVQEKILPMWRLLANNGGDLSMHGDKHFMAEYEPLDADLQRGPDAHMVELISGSGGHSLNATKLDARLAWPNTELKTGGAVYVRLVGAADGGQAKSLSWKFRDTHGTVLRSGSTTC